jgi:hypothetical protein
VHADVFIETVIIRPVELMTPRSTTCSNRPGADNTSAKLFVGRIHCRSTKQHQQHSNNAHRIIEHDDVPCALYKTGMDRKKKK